jgi:hypothetical protein
VAVYSPAAVAGAGGDPVATLSPFGNIGADVRTAVGDIDGDGVPDDLLVTGPGTPIRVMVVSGKDGSTLVAPFDPFGGDFTGGGFVAVGDFDHAGRDEFVVTPDEGGGPRVSIFSLTGGAVSTVADFFGIADPNFRGGARTAVGDINHDGTPELVVAAGFGGGPRVAIYDGATVLSGAPVELMNDFYAFPGTDAVNLRNGVYAVVGDLNGDGYGDLVFGAGPDGGPRVYVLDGRTLLTQGVDAAQAAPLANFFVNGDVTDRGGVRVAATTATGSGMSLVVGSGQGSPARVRVYVPGSLTPAAEPSVLTDLDPFGGAALADGVYVG